MVVSLAVSYNRPRFSSGASWNHDATTTLDLASDVIVPHSIFIKTSNIMYVTDENSTSITAWLDGISVPMRNISASTNLFVKGNGDVYASPTGDVNIYAWPVNATSHYPVMGVYRSCSDIFIDVKNTLYCSISDGNQVISKSLDDPINTLKSVAGTGCLGSAADQLVSPLGIFVDLQFTLYVADTFNDRIQRFSAGERNGVTVAGNGSSGTIDLNHPRDVSLDGDGHLFIVDTDNNRIIGSRPGGFFCVVGCSNMPGAASDQLSAPSAMDFDSHGNIWVVDYNNNRVQKFLVNNSFSGKYSNSSQQPRSVDPTIGSYRIPPESYRIS